MYILFLWLCLHLLFLMLLSHYLCLFPLLLSFSLLLLVLFSLIMSSQTIYFLSLIWNGSLCCSFTVSLLASTWWLAVISNHNVRDFGMQQSTSLKEQTLPEGTAWEMQWNQMKSSMTTWDPSQKRQIFKLNVVLQGGERKLMKSVSLTMKGGTYFF